jgi:GGDEF domain-containing protein
MLLLSYLRRILTISNWKKEFDLFFKRETISRESREQSIVRLFEYAMNQLLELLANRDREIYRLQRLVYQDPPTKLLNWCGLLEGIACLDFADTPFHAPHMIYLSLEGVRGEDELLLVTRILQKTFQPDTSVVARVGEYEFLIFISDTRKVDALTYGEVLRDNISNACSSESRIVLKMGIAEVVIPKNIAMDAIDRFCKEFLKEARVTSRELRQRAAAP